MRRTSASPSVLGLLKHHAGLLTGFTLIEIFITIGIFVSISVLALLNFSIAADTQNARRAAVEFVSHTREMQRRTLSGSTAADATPPVNTPRGGFGIKIAQDGTSYAAVVFKREIKKASDLTDDSGSPSPNISTIATYTFPNPKSMTMAPAGVVFVFTQPKGVLCVCDNSISCTAANTRCGLCREFNSITPPICAVKPSDIPLTTAANQQVTFPISVGTVTAATIIMDLVGARFTAE